MIDLHFIKNYKEYNYMKGNKIHFLNRRDLLKRNVYYNLGPVFPLSAFHHISHIFGEASLCKVLAPVLKGTKRSQQENK